MICRKLEVLGNLEPMHLNRENDKNVSSCGFLGIYFNESLNIYSRNEIVVRKLSRYLFILLFCMKFKNIFYCLNLIQIYYTLVYPYITYCITAVIAPIACYRGNANSTTLQMIDVCLN